MHQLKDKKNKLFFYLILFVLLSTINIGHNNNKNQSIIVIKKIKVNGLSNLDNLKIEENLSSTLLKNIFLIKKENLTKILNNNNAIINLFFIY